MDEITLYQFDPETGEYIDCYTDVDDPRLHKDWRNRTKVAPPKTHQEGWVYIWNGNQWIHAIDHRGQVQYSTADKSFSVIDYIGSVKAGFTLEIPNLFDTWINGQWVTDIEAKEQAEYDAALSQAEASYISRMTALELKIAPLTDAIDLDMATPEEIQRHKTLRQYRVLLSRVKQQENWPLNVNWPEMPQR